MLFSSFFESQNPIDLLMYVYKEEFKSFGGYLVDMERVSSVELVLSY